LIHFTKDLLRWKRINRITDFVTRTKVGETFRVNYDEVKLTLSHANPQLRSRNKSFATKEPETLGWIRNFSKHEVFWDIGANVGLYSIYAAHRGARVYSVEPSVFNLEFLVRNICLNQVADRITILPIAVGTPTVCFESMHLSSSAWGDSGNSFGDLDVGRSGPNRFAYSYKIPGFPIDDLVGKLGVALPDHIKIDVDGIESEIIESGRATFSTVKSVLVEIPAYDGAAERIYRILTNSGLRLQQVARRNQIWIR
jgi:FkbM family methyltransferase